MSGAAAHFRTSAPESARQPRTYVASCTENGLFHARLRQWHGQQALTTGWFAGILARLTGLSDTRILHECLIVVAQWEYSMRRVPYTPNLLRSDISPIIENFGAPRTYQFHPSLLSKPAPPLPALSPLSAHSLISLFWKVFKKPHCQQITPSQPRKSKRRIHTKHIRHLRVPG